MGQSDLLGHEFENCESKRGTNGDPLDYPEKAELIEWLKQRRSAVLGGTIDKAYRSPSATNAVESRTIDFDPIAPNNHVQLLTLPILPLDGPTVTHEVTADGDQYTFSGGVVQMWDRNKKVPEQLALRCPNYDEFIVTIWRQ